MRDAAPLAGAGAGAGAGGRERRLGRDSGGDAPVRALLLDELAAVDGRLVAMAKADPVTRLLMTAPGVGVVVALSFRSAVGDPARFQ